MLLTLAPDPPAALPQPPPLALLPSLHPCRCSSSCSCTTWPGLWAWPSAAQSTACSCAARPVSAYAHTHTHTPTHGPPLPAPAPLAYARTGRSLTTASTTHMHNTCASTHPPSGGATGLGPLHVGLAAVGRMRRNAAAAGLPADRMGAACAPLASHTQNHPLPPSLLPNPAPVPPQGPTRTRRAAAAWLAPRLPAGDAVPCTGQWPTPAHARLPVRPPPPPHPPGCPLPTAHCHNKPA